MDWHVRAEMTGTPTNEQLSQLAEAHEAVVAVHAADGLADLTLTIDADTPADALDTARQALADNTRLVELTAAGVLAPAHRIVVETADAATGHLPVMSTRAVAERLRISEARVRQLKGSAGFPAPLSIPGAAGDFWLRVDVDAYADTRRTEPGGVGRPRAGDEELLRDGLRLGAAYLDLTSAQRGQVEYAAASTGGRYLRGKAKVLTELARRPAGANDRWAEMSADDRARYNEAVLRAHEIWGGQSLA